MLEAEDRDAAELALGVSGSGLPLSVRSALLDQFETMRAADDDYQDSILADFHHWTADLSVAPALLPQAEAHTPLGPRRPALPEEVGLSGSAFDVAYLTSAGYLAVTILSLESLFRCAPGLKAAVTVYCTDEVAQACIRSVFGITTRLWPCRDAGPVSLSMATYREQRFNRIASLKPRIIAGHLDAGRPVLFSDGDVIWRRDPTHLIAGRTSDSPLAMAHDKTSAGIACTGVIAAYPCQTTRSLFSPGLYPPWCGDQAVLNHLMQRGGVAWRCLQEAGFDHGNGVTAESKMQLLADIAPDLPLQDRVHLLTAQFRPPPHTNTGYSGPWIEGAYYAHWLATGCAPGVYLPVFWTDIQVTAPQLLDPLRDFLAGLPSGEYFTVVQHAAGPGLPIPDHIQLKTFCSGRRCAPGCTVVPLLKRELAMGHAARDVQVSFTGTSGRFNDVGCVRSKAVQAFEEAGLLWHYGRGWEAVLQRSQYTLCPRGFGHSSFGLAEAVQAGAVPIVVWEGELLLPDVLKGDTSWCIIFHIDELMRNRHRLRAVLGDGQALSARQQALASVRDKFTYASTVQYISQCASALRAVEGAGATL